MRSISYHFRTENFKSAVVCCPYRCRIKYYKLVNADGDISFLGHSTNMQTNPFQNIQDYYEKCELLANEFY